MELGWRVRRGSPAAGLRVRLQSRVGSPAAGLRVRLESEAWGHLPLLALLDELLVEDLLLLHVDRVHLRLHLLGY